MYKKLYFCLNELDVKEIMTSKQGQKQINHCNERIQSKIYAQAFKTQLVLIQCNTIYYS